MKKARELAHLEHFRQICPVFPKGEIEKTESPDFLVRGGSRLLGIEHTEIFQPGRPHGGSLQAQDSLAQKAVARARELWMEAVGRPLLVQILFHPRVKIAKENIDAIAEAIARAVEKTTIEPGEVVMLKRTGVTQVFLPREVVHIAIRRPLIDKKEEDLWRCSSSGWIPELPPQEIQDVIDKKGRKLANYTLNCSEVWLLIVADAARLPATVDLSESALLHVYTTRFDRVFFFSNADRRYAELNIGVGIIS